ncbi:unnamed protein product [Aphanomyces euteiches]
MGKHVSSPSLNGSANTKDTAVDVVALSRGRFLEHFLSYRERLLAQFVEHQSAAHVLDEEEREDNSNALDDLHAPEEQLDDDGTDMLVANEVMPDDDDSPPPSEHEIDADDRIEIDARTNATSTKPNTELDTHHEPETNAESNAIETEITQPTATTQLSPERKKRPRPDKPTPTTDEVESRKSPTARPPPRKVQRSSTPIRQYPPPVISTNTRLVGLITQNTLDDMSNDGNRLNDNGSNNASLIVMIQTHHDKAQQLQKTPSKKRQLPRLKDPPRLKCHWDTLLDEMKWIAADFAEERHWKRAAAWRLARDVCEAKSAEKKSLELDKRKLARQVALQISSFWRAMERIAARYQSRSSSMAFERTSLNKDTSMASPRLRCDDSIVSFEWIRQGSSAAIREKTSELFNASIIARGNMKKNSGVDEAYAHLKLAQFQWNALRFMIDMREAGYHFILNDQLGTGKPYTVSLFLYVLDNMETPTNPHLIIVPDAEIHKWVHYVRTVHPNRRIQVYGGSRVERRRHQRAWDKEYMEYMETKEDPVYCCICPHAVYLEDAESVFAPQTWQAVIVEDTSICADLPLAYTSLRNSSSRIVVSELALEHWPSERIALWGEFLLGGLVPQWNLMEWDEMNLADPASVQQMLKRAGLPFKEDSSSLQIALRAMTLGRLRNDMEAQLGKVEEQTVGCTMTPSQLKCYNNVVMSFNNSSDKETLDHWLRFMLRLRSACNCVDVLQDFERLSVVDRAMLESCSAKLKVVMELIDRLVHQDHIRVAIYMQCDMMLPVVEYAVTNHLNIPCVRVTGSIVNQHKALTHFASKETVRVAILSTRTRTVGSNRAVCVYGAQAVIVLDSDWDPMCDAKLRASWQLLATNSDVTVYRLYCENTIETSLLRVGSTLSEKLFGEMSPAECIASPAFKYDSCPSWWSSSANNDMSKALMSSELLEKYCGNVENLEWYQLESPLTTGAELETEEHLLLSNSDELTPVEWFVVHLVQSMKEKQMTRSTPKTPQENQNADGHHSAHATFEGMICERNRAQWKQEKIDSLFYDQSESIGHVAQTFLLEGMQSEFGLYEPPAFVDGEKIWDARDDDNQLWITYRAQKPPPVLPPDKLKPSSDLKPIKKKPKVPAGNADPKKSTDYEGFPLPETTSAFDDDGFWGDTNLDALDSVSWDDTSILAGIQVQGLTDPTPQKKLKTSTSILQRPRKPVAEAAREGWSFVEEGLLKKLHDMYGANWNLIAQILTRQSMVKRRSARQCQEKFQRLTVPNKDKPVKVKPLTLSPAAVSSRVGLHTGGVLLKFPASPFGIPPPPIKKNWMLKQPVQDHELRHFRSTIDAVMSSAKKKLPPPPIPIPTSVVAHESHAEILATPTLSPDEVINKSKQIAAATFQAVNAATSLAPFPPESTGLTSLNIATSGSIPAPSDSQTWGDLSVLHQNLARAGAESAISLPGVNGAQPSAATLLYVIDRMPQIKSQIQSILHRNEYSEGQKVALIARLLSSTSQPSSNSSPATPTHTLVPSLNGGGTNAPSSPALPPSQL